MGCRFDGGDWAALHPNWRAVTPSRLEGQALGFALLFSHAQCHRGRCHYVAKTGADSSGFLRTRTDALETLNPLSREHLLPEVSRHHQLGKTAIVEFESLPHRQFP
jgi:hypothetical protein